MRFNFATAGQIVFGAGTAPEAAVHAAQFGRRALVVTGRQRERAEWLFTALRGAGVEPLQVGIAAEPELVEIERAVALAKAERIEVVVGVGGGSAIDAAKAVAALATNAGPVLDYLEVVGRGRPLAVTPLPSIAVPTTAGTGSEVTHNAVISVPALRVKVSLRHVRMAPRVAVIDPQLALHLPPRITAATGLDALTQCIEPWVSNKANPLTDGFCREGIVRAGRSLRRAIDNGSNDLAARRDMALCAVLGGMALANAKLGAVHGLAGPLGGMCGAPHGELCARLLAPVMTANSRALRDRAPQIDVVQRYDELARWLTGEPSAHLPDAIAWVTAVVESAGLPRLKDFGLKREEFADVVAKSQKSSSMQGNPIPLTDAELLDILESAW